LINVDLDRTQVPYTEPEPYVQQILTQFKKLPNGKFDLYDPSLDTYTMKEKAFLKTL